MEERICRNLKYNLDKLMLSSDKDGYSEMVDSVVVGPVNLTHTELNMVLGVNQELFNKSKKKRTDMIESGDKPAWLEKDKAETITRTETVQTTQPPMFGKRRRGTSSLGSTSSTMSSMMRSGLEKQFELFSRFGGSETQGRMITLTQSDKWLRQAGVIDSWGVTTIDTALAFRYQHHNNKH